MLGANYIQAKRAGLDFIAYHYLDTSDGGSQARFFAEVVESACGTLEMGLMVDWERVSYPNGPIVGPGTVDAFLEALAQLAPRAAISVYTAAWVVQTVGPSALASRYPLVWPNYVNGTGDPGRIQRNVTPGEFTPFGGWTSYAARQFTDNAAAGRLSPVDFNVCFDDDAYARLFSCRPRTPRHRRSPLRYKRQSTLRPTAFGDQRQTRHCKLCGPRLSWIGPRTFARCRQRSACRRTAAGTTGRRKRCAPQWKLFRTHSAGLRWTGTGALTDVRFTTERAMLFHP